MRQSNLDCSVHAVYCAQNWFHKSRKNPTLLAAQTPQPSPTSHLTACHRLRRASRACACCPGHERPQLPCNLAAGGDEMPHAVLDAGGQGGRKALGELLALQAADLAVLATWREVTSKRKLLRLGCRSCEAACSQSQSHQHRLCTAPDPPPARSHYTQAPAMAQCTHSTRLCQRCAPRASGCLHAAGTAPAAQRALALGRHTPSK